MKPVITSIDGNGIATIDQDASGNPGQRGRLVVRPGGNVVWEPLPADVEVALEPAAVQGRAPGEFPTQPPAPAPVQSPATPPAPAPPAETAALETPGEGEQAPPEGEGEQTAPGEGEPEEPDNSHLASPLPEEREPGEEDQIAEREVNPG